MPAQESKTDSEDIGSTLKEKILGELQSEEFESRKRGVHVMTRLSEDIVEIIDTLVELDIFRSRSQAVSAYVEKAIYTQLDLYEEVREFGKQFEEIREKAKRMALDAFQEQ